MGQALYRKWRPQTFDDVVGQEHVVRTLRAALQTGHLHHAYLLAGPRGTGKTTTARLIAKAVNCLAPLEERPCDQCEICQAITEGRLMDLMEIDAASNTGVDNIRDLLEKVGFRPTLGRYKVYVVDEVHMLSTAAFNALLKTLEEPPEHVIFVLATTEVHKIPETILSRCQRFEFRRIPLKLIVAQLRTIAEAEGIEAEPDALDLIARTATGSMRDAISLFDQMCATGTVTADYVRSMLGAERREVVQDLLQAWIEGDLQQGLHVINEAVDSGADPRQLARQTTDFLRGLLLMRLGAGESWADPTAEERERLQALARRAESERLVEAVRLFSQVASQRHTGWQPQLPLELAFVEATLEPAPPPASAGQPAPETSPASAPTKPTNHAASKAAGARAPARPVRSVSPPHRGRKPAPASPPSEEAPAAAPAGSIAPALAETIEERWGDLVGHVQPVSLGAFLRGAKPVATDAEGRLVLAFRHQFHCDNVQKDANRHIVEDFLSKTFNQRIGVRCVLAKAWEQQKAAPPQAAAPAPSASTKPASTKPASTKPASTKPASTKPASTKPASTKPASQPARAQSASAPRTPPPPEPPPDDGWLTKDELVRRAQEELGAEARIAEG